MQAISGISDIGPLSFAELGHAVKARADFEWSQTSALMAHMGNRMLELMGCLSKSAGRRRAYAPDDFYRPQLYRRKRRGNMSAERLGSLFAMFTKKAK